MKKWIMLATLFFSVSAIGAEIHLPVPEVETLPNGLQLVWFLDDSLPVVDMALLVKSGDRDDLPGKTGTSELLSSVMDRGASGLTAQQLAKSVEELGASRYVSSQEESFTIGMHGLAPDAGTLLDIMTRIALHPDFPPAEVSREHARILDRWSHVADYGESLAGLAYHRLIANGTTYERGSFASVGEFKKVTRDDVIEFYHRHFTPKNSVLMVVGRANKDVFRKKILDGFGNWQGEAPRHDYHKTFDNRVTVKKGQILIVDRPELTQAQVRIGFVAPLIHIPEHYALVVANALLGEYFNSRLNSLIRDKLALTYSIGSSFAYSMDFATFTISSATRNETTGALIQKSIDVLKELKRGPIPKEEVQMAKEYLVGGFPLSNATLGAIASRWLAGYVFQLGPNYLNEFVPKVSAVTPEDVKSAVEKDFHLDQLVIVVAGDAKEIIKSLKEQDLGSFKLVQVRDLM